jgi:multiple sugar transport system substrate-binding protein
MVRPPVPPRHRARRRRTRPPASTAARRWWLALAAVAVLALGACGDDGDEGSGAGSGGTGAGVTEGAPTAPTLAEAEGATGEVTFCTGQDISGAMTKAIEQFNERYEDQGLTARLREFPAGADEQRTQFIQRQQARSSECDVFYSDVIWTAEFAAQKWLMDMTEYVTSREDEFIASSLEAMQFDGKYWGVPKTSGAGLLYYRTDRVSSPPQTWQEVYAIAERQSQSENRSGIVYQGAAYEGLTCDFLEIAYAAGGQVLNEDGTESAIDSPENLRALEFMVEGIEDGAAPRAVRTYMEEEARRAFQSGRPTFMRNWAYAYALGQRADRIRGDFAVMPLPAFEGAGTGGILGGNNPVISAYSENPEGALLLTDWMTSPEILKQDAVEFALPPAMIAVYDDPEVKEALPFSDELREAIAQASPRPVTAVYPQVSQAIYDNVNAALGGQMSPEDALRQADEEINQALASF